MNYVLQYVNGHAEEWTVHELTDAAFWPGVSRKSEHVRTSLLHSILYCMMSPLGVSGRCHATLKVRLLGTTVRLTTASGATQYNKNNKLKKWSR